MWPGELPQHFIKEITDLVKDLLPEAGVDGRQRVVEKVDGGVLVNGPSQPDPLPLAPAQVLAALLDHRQVALGQPLEVLNEAAAPDHLQKSEKGYLKSTNPQIAETKSISDLVDTS